MSGFVVAGYPGLRALVIVVLPTSQKLLAIGVAERVSSLVEHLVSCDHLVIRSRKTKSGLGV